MICTDYFVILIFQDAELVVYSASKKNKNLQS